MKEMLKILTEDLTLEKALKLKEARKGMDKRWAKQILLPTLIGMSIVCLFIFCASVACNVWDGSMELSDTEEMGRMGAMLVVIVISTMLGLMIAYENEQLEIDKAYKPIIDDALKKLAEDEDEKGALDEEKGM